MPEHWLVFDYKTGSWCRHNFRIEGSMRVGNCACVKCGYQTTVAEAFNYYFKEMEELVGNQHSYGYFEPPTKLVPQPRFVIVNATQAPFKFTTFHATESAAVTEAKRLAALAPGDSFMVLKEVGKAKAEKPVTPPPKFVEVGEYK